MTVRTQNAYAQTAREAIDQIEEDLEQAIDLLMEICEADYWLKDPTNRALRIKVREWLTNMGLHPRPYDH